MDSGAFLAALILLLSLFVKDLYLNSLDSATSRGAAKETKVIHEEDLGLDDIIGSDDSTDPHFKKKVKPKDDFFDDDDIDIKSHMEDLKSDGPGSRISSAKFTGPTIKFLYCSSTGYRNAYDQFVAIIQDKHPELFVEGAQYPPETWRTFAGQTLNLVKFLIIGSILASQYSLLHMIGIPIAITNWMTQNKVYAGLLSFFFFNFLETQLVSTGAFEIFVDDVPIWSKLQTGRVPSPPELMQIIDNQLKMGGREPVMDGFKI